VSVDLTFRCDFPGCSAAQTYPEPGDARLRSLQIALLARGWAESPSWPTGPRSGLFCPKHASAAGAPQARLQELLAARRAAGPPLTAAVRRLVSAYMGGEDLGRAVRELEDLTGGQQAGS
jgi:hypothetical protein